MTRMEARIGPTATARTSVVWCRACRRPLDPGEALRVTHNSGMTFTLCRPSIRPACLSAAGPSFLTAITLLDPDAARRWDAPAP